MPLHILISSGNRTERKRAMTDYYKLLDVSRDASAEEIKQAYRKLAKRYHPDVNQGSENAAHKFKLIHEAYDTLRSEASRQAYDDRLKQEQRTGSQAAQKGGPQADRQAHATGTGAYTPPDAASVAAEFERFFGYAPRTGKKAQKKPGKKPEGPLDADNLFSNFFGIRK